MMAALDVSTDISSSSSSSSHQRNSPSTFSLATSPSATDARSVYRATSRSNSAVSTPVYAASPPASTPGGAPTTTPNCPTNASHAPHQLPAIRPNAAQPISVRPPQVLNKMSMASVISPPPTAEAPKMSMTTKEWVIPPRPKPGRKPATDTPPTKRKAQNRAAQRAFRERRAARVGELEEQLDEIRETHEKAEQELKDRVHGLEMDLQSFKSRCLVLENMLDRERKDRVKAETELEGLKRRWSDQATAPRRLPSPRRRDSQFTHHEPSNPSVGHSNQPFSISQIVSPQDSTHMSDSPAPFGCGSCGPDSCACANDILADTVIGCGNCTLGGRCACLEETIKSAIVSDLKRAPSPSAVVSVEKRHRTEPTPPDEETEIDFTAMFSKKAPAQQQQQQQQPTTTSSLVQSHSQLPSMAFKDSCGFCKDGSYCLCADTAIPLGPPATTDYGPPPAYSQQTQTPPPSENDAVPPPIPMEIDANGAVKLRPRPQTTQPVAPVSRGCGPKGPGSCAQCLADPKSGLFCRALSANIERNGGSSGGGCCGGAGASGGCCKSESAPPRLPTKGKLGLSLSCAEAYQTLSSHRNFEKAADDIGSWLPKLRAAPNPGQTLPSSSRLPIEVEAASIMSVLKDFDIRFGRGQ
ncbi:bZIP transcription factor [Colletotrichum graminicola M1.001]|uniref:BZIP transcription factor n=1 Tax=Colletotrichum graminicola (strain M1.001 / M2 / FGSC 10212) TaxID=645133 RepID=E3QVM7_COLGM|nr:bZIP transcription factor [Colletotrichum graminicola M1.001]EFQ34915.1 bZIP transcription factor [Colletotrichum graminicola M1.001]